MATMSLDELVKQLRATIEAEDLPDSGVGGVLLSLAHSYDMAAAIFTSDEIPENLEIDHLEEAMISHGNTLASIYAERIN